MTPDSNRNAYTPWGEPTRTSPEAWWARFVTVPILLGHIVTMFSVMALLTTVNLILNPGTWWSLAILVLWITIVIVHVLARYSLGFLLQEEPDVESPRQQVRVEPNGGTVHGPAEPPNGQHPSRREDVPISWELKSDDDVPATWQTGDSGPRTDDPPTEQETEDSNGSNERVPWRAATDIAWLRRQRTGGQGGSASDANEEAPL